MTTKPKRIKKKTKQFTVLVSQDLFEQANKVRKKTWVDQIEGHFVDMIVASAPKGKKS